MTENSTGLLEGENPYRRLASLERTQKAMLNVLEDMDEERGKSQSTQIALLNILEDIEEQREKVERTKAMLESVNRELEAFSYSVSHDLRAPLRAISGFSEAVMEDYAPKLDDEGRRYLTLIQDNAHRMGQLIDDLLAFSRLGRASMTLVPIDIGVLARSIFAELAELEPERSIAFDQRPVPSTWGDLSMIRLVLTNLISNAIKFTRGRQDAKIELGFDPETNAYYIRDNGAGFDMQYYNKLFAVFQRLHSAQEFEGNGVGLALVQRIITRHGGRVWAEGRVDEGATFYFILPGRES
ncbi:MAG: ATP-binding protein [Methanomassiliicoccales archaeon]|nr:ATP-binding protein [Methanomassiliicoccales archaeon]